MLHVHFITPNSPFAPGHQPPIPLATGPFCPPADYVFEPPLQHPIPRPISWKATLPYADFRRQAKSAILAIASVVLAVSYRARVQKWPMHFVSVTYLSWIGYGLIALWAAFVALELIQRFAALGICRFVRSGRPLVCRVLALANVPDEGIYGYPLTNSIIALIEFQHPETGQVCRSEAKSMIFTGAERRNYTTSFRVGDYVTAIYVPDDLAGTVTLYSFLGLSPNEGLVRRTRLPWRFPFALQAPFFIMGCFALLEGCAFACRFYQPMGFGDRQELMLLACGSLLSPVVCIVAARCYWYHRMRRTAQLNAIAVAEGEPFEISPSRNAAGFNAKAALLAIGAIAGGLIAISGSYAVNALGDDSPAREQNVEILRLEAGGSDSLCRGYSIVYREHMLQRASRLGTTPEHYADLQRAGGGIGVAEIHRGLFGWRWIKEIRPLVKAAGK